MSESESILKEITIDISRLISELKPDQIASICKIGTFISDGALFSSSGFIKTRQENIAQFLKSFSVFNITIYRNIETAYIQITNTKGLMFGIELTLIEAGQSDVIAEAWSHATNAFKADEIISNSMIIKPEEKRQ
ncbi:MAG: hypothetical protein ACJAYB_000026 [Psychromonas sp.]|jgi:hypothetical protein